MPTALAASASRVYIQLETEWRIVPWKSACLCEAGEGTRYSFPFFSLYILKELKAGPQ